MLRILSILFYWKIFSFLLKAPISSADHFPAHGLPAGVGIRGQAPKYSIYLFYFVCFVYITRHILKERQSRPRRIRQSNRIKDRNPQLVGQ